MKHLKRLIFIFFLLAVCAGTFSCSATPQRIYYLLKYKNNYNIKSDSPTIHSLKEILEKNEKIKFYPNNSLTLLQTGDEVLSRMYRLIESANSEICIDQYIFRNDEVGIDFFKLLQQKSESGVKVRIIIDKLGSFGPSFYYSKYLKSASKIQLRFFNPVLWWSIIKINNRDHSKLLIVDSKTAVISGIGLGKEYKYWRDIGVEIQGPVLFDIKKKFEETWRKSGYGWFGKDIPFPGLNELKSEFDKLFLKKIKIDDSLKNNLQGSADARLLQASPDFSNRIVFETFLKAINSSSNYVYITNSYFLPNKLFRNSLINAVKRGVDVKIILPSKTDLPLLRRTSHLYYPELLKNGIKIYELKDRVLHAKYMLSDDIWCSVGSVNILDRAFFMNIENNIEILDSDFTIELKKLFLNDLENSSQIIYEQWKKTSFIKKLGNYILFPTIFLY